ncbi:MAG: iorB1 [Betaproteobacteria bacterium]|nr:iorB1 [Betaproteobacteria bacterium]
MRNRFPSLVRTHRAHADAAPDPQAQTQVVNLSTDLARRRFLQGMGGLTLGVGLTPWLGRAGRASAAGAEVFAPNAFLRIGTDGSVTVIAKHMEMGQGAHTGLATLVAEELDADWARVRVEGAPVNTKLYANLAFGAQGTGGSTAMANSWEQMRRAGATARAMLVAAAAQQWSVPAAGITVSEGVVKHAASGRSATFGELAQAASALPVPTEVTLKSPAEFKLIGKQKLPRVDTFAKTNGTAVFTQDIKLPGMLVAIAAHPPRFGAKVKSFDAAKAKAIPGVLAVVQFEATPSSFAGVAVLAKNTWVARQGRDALQVQWEGGYAKGSEAILAQYREALKQPGLMARKDGNVDAALARPGKLIEAEYSVPFLAHAAMEPMNCLVKLEADGAELWNGEQWQTIDQMNIAKLLGVAPEKVRINQLYAGGSFGRRANPHSDYLLEAVQIARAARAQGISAPVKMVWTREDDMRGGHYRPLYLHQTRLSLDAAGQPQALQVRMAGQSIIAGLGFDAFIKDGVDQTSVEGMANLPYDIPNLQVELYTPTDVGVPIQWFRSVGSTQNGFVGEALIDEAATTAGKDPVAYRRALLSKHLRHRGVLDLAAEKAEWTKPLKPAAAGEKRGRGVAVHEAFGTFVAQVVEVTVKADGSFKVDRIVCAVDCGVAINPDVIRAQMEGGIGYGLSVALHGAITLKDGVVEQSNFHDYQALRINEMPAVEVHIMPSAEKPTGVGEPGVPPVAPALANALFQVTGKRIRTMPIPDKV